MITEKEFKTLFNNIATINNFVRLYGGWLKKNEECIMILDLQKSDFSKFYYLNIKVYIQGLFGDIYTLDKKLIKKDVGDIFRRAPSEYDEAFHLDNSLSIYERENMLIELFDSFLNAFSKKAETKKGILELYNAGDIILLPAVKNQLIKLTD